MIAKHHGMDSYLVLSFSEGIIAALCLHDISHCMRSHLGHRTAPRKSCIGVTGDIRTSMLFLPSSYAAICCSNHLPNFGDAQVPYGSSFHSHLQWDAVSVGEKQTRLRVSCEVRRQLS